ncbi:hypothetical protein KFE98_06610 [bacterium SCSIO 12741]|nr:hypothetical protein KFE98_06610 [bacterium SCSIO 12741]
MAALLASRFENLEELKKEINLFYTQDSSNFESDSTIHHKVVMLQCAGGGGVVSVLESGITQKEVAAVKNADLYDKLKFGISSPYSVANRESLQQVFLLARRRSNLFGEKDFAFYDLALAHTQNISTPELAYLTARDSSEKGYINSFNHITAQAFITTLYSRKLADFVADLHERYAMPELLTGEFTEDQLSHPDDNPVDNYVDMINNEWGQQLGLDLKKKYSINPATEWTPELLANYLNDLQEFYSWSFQVAFKPFRPDQEIVIRFSQKIMDVQSRKYLYER